VKHKLIGSRNRSKPLPVFPSDLYKDFRGLLVELLDKETHFKYSYLKSVFESKLIDFASPITSDMRKSRAIAKWLATEANNQTTNMRLMHADSEDIISSHDDKILTYGMIRDHARKFIALTIGHTVNFDLFTGAFSGGASTSIKRGVGTVARKFQTGTNITSKAIVPYMQMARMSTLLPHHLVEVKGNVLFTVEKNSDIDRVACKEPELNMFCQKAVGDFFRNRLRRKGIDLNDQKVNQDLARQGSIDGTLATLDLSSASDSVTTQIVTELLPIDWSLLLMDLRSPVTLVEGIPHQNEMISSMGNGFTFELESLIFWALIRATTYSLGVVGTIGVYGDDLIVPSGAVSHLIDVLKFFGFTLNPDKSFWTGSFRESCGKHWYSGMDVTPFYVKAVPRTVPQWCNLLNSLRRWAHSNSGICDPDYYDLWSLFAELIPRSIRGSSDLNRNDALVDPTIRNLAVCRALSETDTKTERRYQFGAFVHWLSTNDRRPPGSTTPSTKISLFTVEGELRLRRKGPWSDTLDIPSFPQEVGCIYVRP
jgi:hypothetical protein